MTVEGVENSARGGDDFDHFADDWWDPKGRLKSLHRITPIRFAYYLEKAQVHLGGLEGKRVLDVGCGGGLLSEKFALEGALVTAIDLSPMAIEAARRHSTVTAGVCEKIDYRLQSVAELRAEAPEPFDIVVSSEVLEHVDDVESLLADACALLKEGGIFLFSTINKTLKARFFALFVAEDLLGLVPPGTHDYERFIKPSLLMKYFSASNVTVEELKGMSYDPLRLEFKISSDTSVNYLGYAVKR